LWLLGWGRTAWLSFSEVYYEYKTTSKFDLINWRHGPLPIEHILVRFGTNPQLQRGYFNPRNGNIANFT
jgi:hypothetical protein